MNIELDSKKLNYCGRIDQRNSKKPEFIFPASSVEIHFLGKSASIEISNKNEYYRNFIGAIIDGEMKKFEIKKQGISKIKLFEMKKEMEHTIIIYKVLDACHEYTIEKIELSDDAILLPAAEKPRRKIEFYGDSISAGEITEAIDYIGMEDPEHEGEYSNSWYSYAWLTARKLNAEIHDIAQGGIALLNGSGWYQEPTYLGMEEMWDSVHYADSFGSITKWDFSKFTPDVVVVAIGQNDSNPDDYMAKDYQGEKSINWRKKYREFILKIRGVYPNAWIILKTTLMFHNENWDYAIDEVCKKIDDKRICHFMYVRNGKGSPGHMRIIETEEMAMELAAYIEDICF